jgi:hypothetical protein
VPSHRRVIRSASSSSVQYRASRRAHTGGGQRRRSLCAGLIRRHGNDSVECDGGHLGSRGSVQTPVAGTQVGSGSAVALVVSSGPSAGSSSPNLVGLTLQAGAASTLFWRGPLLGRQPHERPRRVRNGCPSDPSPVRTPIAGRTNFHRVAA